MIPKGGVYTLSVHAENGLGIHSLRVHLHHHFTQYKTLMQTLMQTHTQALRVNRASGSGMTRWFCKATRFSVTDAVMRIKYIVNSKSLKLLFIIRKSSYGKSQKAYRPWTTYPLPFNQGRGGYPHPVPVGGTTIQSPTGVPSSSL